MEEGSIDAAEIPIQFEGMITAKLLAIITAHGIKLQSETPLWMINDIVMGLLGIEYYLDNEEMLRIMESDSDSEEKLARMINAVIGTDADVIVQYIEEMNDSLLDRAQELFTARVIEPPGQLQEDSENYKLVHKLKDVARHLGNQELLAIQILHRGVLPGALFSEYLRYIQHSLDDIPASEAAFELFALLAISHDGSKNMLQTYAAHSEFLFHDMDLITKVRACLITTQQNFDRYLAERQHVIANA